MSSGSARAAIHTYTPSSSSSSSSSSFQPRAMPLGGRSFASVSSAEKAALVTMPRSFELTVEEQELFGLLGDVVKARQLDVTLRVVGGWVRDKLLGVSAGDIDIAVDTMSGADFAEHLTLYQAGRGEIVKQGTVRRNPEQSKHLETVVVAWNGKSIDIVNLRSETYASDSRIPSMEFGTPLQDAERRDFTVNSMFYNLSTDKVEDYTGKGLMDLSEGLLRTPLDAQVILAEDPLRVLRCVRFAATQGMQVDEDVFRAVAALPMESLLRSKVSRPRIGKEMASMVAQPGFDAGMALLHRMALLPAVFVGKAESPSDNPAALGEDLLARLRILRRVLDATAGRAGEPHDQRLLVLGSVCADMLHSPSAPEWPYEPFVLNGPGGLGVRSKQSTKSVRMQFVRTVLRGNLDLPDRTIKGVATMLAAADFFDSHWIQLQLFEMRSADEDAMGKVSRLRKQRSNTKQFDAVFQQLVHVARMSGDQFHDAALMGAMSVWHQTKQKKAARKGAVVERKTEEEEAAQVIELYDMFVAASSRVWRNTSAGGLEEVQRARPVLDGAAVRDLTGAQGPEVQRTLDRLLLWQLVQTEPPQEQLPALARAWLEGVGGNSAKGD
jgi:hypothetical protein